MISRRGRRLLGLLILLISLAILLWGIWPLGEASRSIPIPASDLQLPTPGVFLPGWFSVSGIRPL